MYTIYYLDMKYYIVMDSEEFTHLCRQQDFEINDIFRENGKYMSGKLYTKRR